MKRSINEIYNTIVNYLIESFHMVNNKIKRKLKRLKNKFKKFYYYEIMGIVTISVYFYKGLKGKILKKSKNIMKSILNI